MRVPGVLFQGRYIAGKYTMLEPVPGALLPEPVKPFKPMRV